MVQECRGGYREKVRCGWRPDSPVLSPKRMAQGDSDAIGGGKREKQGLRGLGEGLFPGIGADSVRHAVRGVSGSARTESNFSEPAMVRPVAPVHRIPHPRRVRNPARRNVRFFWIDYCSNH